MKDIRHAVRTLKARPLIPALVVVLLAFGVGANTAIFTVAKAAVLTQLPYPNADRLVAIWQDLENRGVENYPSAPADLVDYRALDAFDEVAGMFAFDHSIVDDQGQAHKIRMAQVTDNLDETLGIAPALGRLFEPADAVPQANTTTPAAPISFKVVITHDVWQTRFGGDPNILGRSIQFGAGPGEVIGVLQPGFRLILNPETGWVSDVDVFLPYQVDWAAAPRSSWFLTTVALLSPEADLVAAQSQLGGVEAQWWQEFPVNKNAGTRIRAELLHQDVTSAVRPAIAALAGTVCFLLIVACVNLASLILVRANGRAHELSIRSALGGGRAAMLRLQLSEIVVLAMLGSALGLLIAKATLAYLLTFRPPELVDIGDPRLDPWVLAFAAILSLSASLLASFWPALRASRPDLLGALRGQVGRTQTKAVRRALSGLIVVQVALTMTLLVGGALMMRSMNRLQGVDLGFVPEGVLTFETSAPGSTYSTPEERVALHERITEGLLALPTVTAAAASSALPLSGNQNQGPYGGERELADNDEGDLRQAYWRFVSPGYFEALGTRLLEGRTFTIDDERAAPDAEAPKIVMVDLPVAERSWTTGQAITGKDRPERLYIKSQQPPIWADVVGVVENQRQALPFGEEQGTIYFPGPMSGTRLNWVVRTEGDPAALAPQVRDLFAGIDPRITVAEVEPLHETVARARAPMRFTATLVGLFGVLASILAICGLWGVLSYNVSQQESELGIRMALGAEREHLLVPVLTRALVLTGTGVVLGLALSVPATRLLENQLVGISSIDLTSYLAAAAGFLSVAFLASLGPAIRASRLDPNTALRPD